MSTLIPGLIVFTLFFLLAAVTFGSLMDSWNTHTNEFSVAQTRLVNGINSHFSISSA